MRIIKQSFEQKMQDIKAKTDQRKQWSGKPVRSYYSTVAYRQHVADCKSNGK